MRYTVDFNQSLSPIPCEVPVHSKLVYPRNEQDWQYLRSFTSSQCFSDSLMSLQAYERLFSFVKESVGHFDESHNEEHALRVWENAMEIALHSPSVFAEDLISYASLLHDVCDHKYPDSIGQEELDRFMLQELGPDKASWVKEIIGNISFSKEVAGKRKDLPSPYDSYLTIVADADRLEAIGQVGIARCIQFTRARNGQVPQDVLQHCHEKLLRLYKDHFIKTPHGRKLALPLHQLIEDYVREHEPLCE